jgi:hypothetical protein
MLFAAAIASFMLDQRFTPSGRKPRDRLWQVDDLDAAFNCIWVSDDRQAISQHKLGDICTKVNAIEVYDIWVKLYPRKLITPQSLRILVAGQMGDCSICPTVVSSHRGVPDTEMIQLKITP